MMQFFFLDENIFKFHMQMCIRDRSMLAYMISKLVRLFSNDKFVICFIVMKAFLNYKHSIKYLIVTSQAGI